MNDAVLLFAQVGEQAVAQVGGKGANLARLARMGAPVPPGLCVTTTAFWRFLEVNGLLTQFESLSVIAGVETESEQVKLKLASLRQAIAEAEMPEQLTGALVQALRELSAEARFAVRSSATSEDLEEASFAGQYDTFLNIALSEISEKIKHCFASYWNERAFLYRLRNGIDHFAHGMGVVVQQLVEAESSGVLFTLNPLSGNERELIIEACWGLGEALVSGLVTPDRFVIDPFANQIRARQIARKVLKMVPDSTGVREIQLEGAEAERPVLSEEAALELARLAIDIHRHYGQPVDIEWARAKGRFYILQVRPLTAFSFAPELGQWTSANFREVMPGLVNPLSFSLSLHYGYGNALDEFFTRLGLRKDRNPVEWSRRFFGRAYWNVDIVKQCAGKLPGYCERAFDVTIGIEPDYAGDGERTLFTPATLLRALPVFLRLQWYYRSFWREAERYEREYAAIDKELAALDCTALKDAELAEWTRKMVELHYRTNRIALICSFLATESQTEFRHFIDNINKWLPTDRQVSVANLLTGLANLSTAEPLIELWHLAAAARADRRLTEMIATAEPGELISVCENLPGGSEFAARLKNYLERFAFLAANDEDLSCPRWANEPGFPLTILRNFVLGGEAESPALGMARQRQSRVAERERSLSAIGNNPVRRRLFLGKLELVTRYCRWREITRISLSKTYYHCHRVFLEQGRRLAARGVIALPEDIFWLEREELLDLLDGKLSSEEARQKIAGAKLITECYRSFNPPTTIGKGSRVAPKRTATDGKIFNGVACSAGEVVARARVIRSLSEVSKLARGEILVAPHTNPGWTPLFSLASAVVLEEGGLLSHGAVVARECGIPTVLQIKGATEIFRDGQLLRVDGTRGEVEILPE
jgi:phosphoenolpyruvate synthase/pyruvate phosphate dikinase